MKIALVILVVIAALYTVLVLTGPWDKTTATAKTFSARDLPSLQAANSLLAPLAPKVAAKSLVAASPAATSALSFDLSQAPDYKVTVLPDPSKQFRQLRFTATPSKSCMLVKYEPTDKGGMNQSENSNDSGDSSHPERFTFVFLSGGGELDIRRASSVRPALCVVTLEADK